MPDDMKKVALEAADLADDLQIFSNLIGKQSELVVWPIEQSAIRRILRALSNVGPYWKEIDSARIGTAVTVHPAYFFSIRAPELKIEVPYRVVVAGGDQWTFFPPLQLVLGRDIVVTRKLKDIQRKQGKAQSMVLIVFEDTFESESGQVLATRQTTQIRL